MTVDLSKIFVRGQPIPKPKKAQVPKKERYSKGMDEDTSIALEKFATHLVVNDIQSHYKTGSQLVSGVNPKDYDWVVYESEEQRASENSVLRYLELHGYERCGAKHYRGIIGKYFSAWRKFNLNIIYTNDKDFYDRYVASTIWMEKKQPHRKEDRIAIFESIMGDKYREEIQKTEKTLDESLVFAPF